jgi:hypothetical protein
VIASQNIERIQRFLQGYTKSYNIARCYLVRRGLQIPYYHSCEEILAAAMKNHMNRNNRSTKQLPATVILILTATILAWVGCATKGYEKSETAATSLHTAAGEVQAESRALNATLNSLNDLINKPPTDLKLQYKAYSTNLDQLIAAARRNDGVLRRVGQKNAAYFESWDKDLATMNYEAVRNRSQERKSEVTANFDSVYRRYQEAQTTIHPLLEYFEDIRKALSTDLTVGGLEAMKPTVANVNENAAKVQTALARLADDLAASGAKMSSVAAQNRQP